MAIATSEFFRRLKVLEDARQDGINALKNKGVIIPTSSSIPTIMRHIPGITSESTSETDYRITSFLDSNLFKKVFVQDANSNNMLFTDTLSQRFGYANWNMGNAGTYKLTYTTGLAESPNDTQNINVEVLGENTYMNNPSTLNAVEGIENTYEYNISGYAAALVLKITVPSECAIHVHYTNDRDFFEGNSRFAGVHVSLLSENESVTSASISGLTIGLKQSAQGTNIVYAPEAGTYQLRINISTGAHNNTSLTTPYIGTFTIDYSSPILFEKVIELSEFKRTEQILMQDFNKELSDYSWEDIYNITNIATKLSNVCPMYSYVPLKNSIANNTGVYAMYILNYNDRPLFTFTRGAIGDSSYQYLNLQYAMDSTQTSGLGYVGIDFRKNLIAAGQSNYRYQPNVTLDTEGNYYIYDENTESFLPQSLPADFKENTRYYIKETVEQDGVLLSELKNAIAPVQPLSTKIASGIGSDLQETVSALDYWNLRNLETLIKHHTRYVVTHEQLWLASIEDLLPGEPDIGNGSDFIKYVFNGRNRFTNVNTNSIYKMLLTFPTFYKKEKLNASSYRTDYYYGSSNYSYPLVVRNVYTHCPSMAIPISKNVAMAPTQMGAATQIGNSFTTPNSLSAQYSLDSQTKVIGRSILLFRI